MVCVVLPIKVISEANCRDHWRKSAPRKALHRCTARSLLLARAGRGPGAAAGQISITLTRIAPRTLDDDNLASGFKATRDGVADWLGIDDGSKRLTWRYEQRKGTAGQYAAEVVVTWGATC